MRCSQALHMVHAASIPWNETGNVNVQLKPPVSTSVSTRVSDSILYRAMPQNPDPSVVALVEFPCDSGLGITVDVSFESFWTTTLPMASGNQDLVGILMHAIGHALGLGDADDGTAACGGSPHVGRAIMAPDGPSRTVGTGVRALFYDDWTALRDTASTCAYTPSGHAGTARIWRTPNGGVTAIPLSLASPPVTNARIGLVPQRMFGFSGEVFFAYLDTNNDVVVADDVGNVFGVFGPAAGPPSLATGGGRLWVAAERVNRFETATCRIL